MTLEDFVKYIAPIIVAAIAATPGILSLRRQQAKEAAESLKATSEGNKIKADTVETFEGIARRTAEDVVRRDDRIKALEDRMDAQDAEISALKAERDMLLKKNADQAERMKWQDQTIEKLTARVKVLEDLLVKHDVPSKEWRDE